MTIRQQLNNLGFDWVNGELYYQPVTEDAYCPGWARSDELLPIGRISSDHEVLDQEYDGGFGYPNCPRVMAIDQHKIYHPSQYDGSSWMTSYERNPPTDHIPYTGRG